MTIADFNLKPKEVGADLPIKFEISYTSNDGIRQVEEKQLTLYSAPFSPSVESGVPKESGSSSFATKQGRERHIRSPKDHFEMHSRTGTRSVRYHALPFKPFQ